MSSEKCLNNLNRYVENTLKPYQVVLLTNSESNLIGEYVIGSILRNIPFIEMDLNKMSRRGRAKSMKSPSFGLLRKTSMFLLTSFSYNDTNNSHISLSLKYLSDLSPGRVRPKIMLLFLTNRKYSFETFLHRMWINHFLEFTILEMFNVKQQHFRHFESVELLIHHYNPFTNMYKRRKCLSNSVWFPKKLFNLHGYPIKAGLAFRPPYSLVEYDKTGRLIEQKGADVKMFNGISEAMNFSSHIISDVNSSVGVFQGKKATGMLGNLIENKINVLITSVLNFRPNADGALYRYSSTIEMESFVVVVPITHLHNDEDVLNLDVLYNRIFLFIGFILFVWVTFHKCSNFWKADNISALILGVTIDHKPTLTGHRIVFIYLIAIGFCYSSSFLGGLTASHVKETEEVRYETLQDLGNSNLVPMIHPNFFYLSLDDSEELRVLKNKTIVTELVDSLCPAILVMHKNVTCLLMSAYAKQLIEVMRDPTGLPVAKILSKSLFTARRTLAVERNSPYKERLDEIITIFTEAGLRMKWANEISDRKLIFDDSKFKEQKSMNVNNLGAVSKLKRVLFLVTLPGYLISVLLFVGEVLFKYFNKSV